jgi:hypothetical protein
MNGTTAAAECPLRLGQGPFFAGTGTDKSRRKGTRISDLYRVNSEVNNLKPFACLALPCTTYLKTRQKQPTFGDELVTSFLFHSLENVVIQA